MSLSSAALRGACAVATAAALAAAAGPASAATSANGVIAYSAWDDSLNYDIWIVDPATDQPPQRLTLDGAYNANPTWSPDGLRIAYDGWADAGGPRIRAMDADPATDDSVTISDPCATSPDCYGDFQPAWSPDGTRVAFVSSRPDPDGTPNWSYELYVMDALGETGAAGRATRLTTDVADEFGGSIEDSQVTWSPDSRRIAFLSTGRGAEPDSCDLWVMDAQDSDGDGFGDNLQRLTFDESFNCDAFEDVTPSWAPAGDLIAFTSVRSGYFDIWVVNAADPSDLRNVTQTDTEYEDQPSWSPDGTQIVFRSAQTGAYEFYSLPVPPPAGSIAGGAGARDQAVQRLGGAPAPVQLTADGMNKQHAAWGPQAGEPATRELTVKVRGRGRVTSRDDGIACGTDCAATMQTGARVVLRAMPRAGQRFAGWDGACASFGMAERCTLRLRGDRTVRARFEPQP